MFSYIKNNVLFLQVLRFSLVGSIGFIVDTIILYTCIYFLFMNLYWGRLVSYTIAASSTWYMNRRYTFSDNRNTRAHKEWMLFVAVNALGGLVNYGTYAVLVSSILVFREYPVLAVGVGSVAGLIFNFTLSKKLVFR